MSEDSELYQQMREDSKARKTEKENAAHIIINDFCILNNYSFQEIASYHFRVTGKFAKIDIYPQRNKYHNLINNRRGSYKDLQKFLNTNF